MDHASSLELSAKLERHIALVEADVTRQRELVVELLRDGHDATSAGVLLRQFEELLTRLFADREVLRRRLGAKAR